MSFFARTALCAVVLVVATTFGCTVLDDRSPFETPDATVRINLTDAPSDAFASAEVSFSRVLLVGAEDGSVVDLLSTTTAPPRFDLMRLRGDAEALLVEAHVPSGRYGKLTLVVDRARVRLAPGFVFRDGSAERVIEAPGGRSRFIDAELDAPLDAVAGAVTLLVVDFDVDESFAIDRDETRPGVVRDVSLIPILREKRRHGLPLD